MHSRAQDAVYGASLRAPDAAAYKDQARQYQSVSLPDDDRRGDP